MRARLIYSYQPTPSRPQVVGAHAPHLACGCLDVDRIWNLGNAFHRHAGGIPSAYNILLTILSLFTAIILCGSGLSIAVASISWVRAALGGAIVGGGIAAMHYMGMAAFEIQGRIIWDPTLVTASIILGAAIGAAALPVGLHSGSIKWKMFGAAFDGGDLQSPLHRNGRSRDHSRSDD